MVQNRVLNTMFFFIIKNGLQHTFSPSTFFIEILFSTWTLVYNNLISIV